MSGNANKEASFEKVDDSLVDEVKHVLLLVDFCRYIDRISFSLVCFLIFQYLALVPCLIQEVQSANSFPTPVSVIKCLPDIFLFVNDFLNL